MRKAILVAMPLAIIAPALLLLGSGSANIEAVRAACTGTTKSGMSGVVRVGTLNWRGASHYTNNPHPGERPYGERVSNMVTKIGASGASIIGFQEFEPPQATAFLNATSGAWAIVRGNNGTGKPSTANAIAYQPSSWRLGEVRHVSIPYGGSTIAVPMARFTSTAGLGPVWVLNTHNPADAVGGTNAIRDRAVRSQARALQELQVAEPRTPLLLTGDMNDRTRFKELFLSLAPGWAAANPTDGQIDWILGSPAVTFSDTVVDHSTNDQAHAYTDHPFVHTTARLSATTAAQPATGAEPGAIPSRAPGPLPGRTPPAETTPATTPMQTPSAHQASVDGVSADAVLTGCLLCLAATRLNAPPRAATSASLEARDVVAADGTNAVDTGCTVSPPLLAGELSDAISGRIDAMLRSPAGLCSLSWTSGAPCTYQNQCPKVVDALYGGPGVGRGYGDGEDVARGIIAAGLTQSHGTGLDPLPPVGAVVSYDRGDGVGHVAIYVGNGQIFGNDYGCISHGIYGCVGFADVHAPGGSVTWALPLPAFDLGGAPNGSVAAASRHH